MKSTVCAQMSSFFPARPLAVPHPARLCHPITRCILLSRPFGLLECPRPFSFQSLIFLKRSEWLFCTRFPQTPWIIGLPGFPLSSHYFPFVMNKSFVCRYFETLYASCSFGKLSQQWLSFNDDFLAPSILPYLLVDILP